MAESKLITKEGSVPKEWDRKNIALTVYALIALLCLLLGGVVVFILLVLLGVAGFAFSKIFLENLTPEKLWLTSGLLFILAIVLAGLTPGAPDEVFAVIGGIATAFFGFMYSQRRENY